VVVASLSRAARRRQGAGIPIAVVRAPRLSVLEEPDPGSIAGGGVAHHAIRRVVHSVRGGLGEIDQRRLDSPADVVRVSEIELEEDRVDVLLDGALG
jgi:hypothetical protein